MKFMPRPARLCIPILLAFLTGSMRIPAADSSELRARIQSSRVRISRNQFSAAIDELLLTLTAARRSNADGHTVGEILSDLGYAYRMRGECRSAITVLQTADQLLRSSPERRISGVNLAASYLACGELRRADVLWQHSLAPIARAAGAKDSPLLWTAGATIQAARGRYAVSEALYSNAIAIWEEFPTFAPERLALAHISRGVDRAVLGRFDEANEDAVDSPALTKLAACTRATGIGNIALVRLLTGHIADASPAFEEALEILGPSPECSCAAAIFANYAAFLRRIGDRKRSNAASRRAEALARGFRHNTDGETIDARAFLWSRLNDGSR